MKRSLILGALVLACGGAAEDPPLERGPWACSDEAAQARDGMQHVTWDLTAEDAEAWEAGNCWDTSPIAAEDVPLHPGAP